MAVYQNPPLTDVTPVSGILSYADGVRTGTFTVQSIQDIEEEDNEVFSVRLMSSKGGASLSIADSRTTLTGMSCVIITYTQKFEDWEYSKYMI